MVLFWRLVLAHVVADFPLQTDAVFLIKKRFSWGVLLHGAIFALTSILATGPYLNSSPFWGGLFLLWLFHAAVDKAKLSIGSSGRGDHVGFFLLDQMLHVGAIGLISLFFGRGPQATVLAESSAALIPKLKLGVAYVIAIWVSPLLAFYIRADYARFRTSRSRTADAGSSQQAPEQVPEQTLGHLAQPPTPWRIMGYVERGCLVAVITQGSRLLFLIPLILLPRVGLRVSAGRRGAFLWELVVGSLVALSMGLWGSSI
jgi:hypothetical protein